MRCGCWLENEAATVFGNTVDLGQGGLFLRTALPMQPGSCVRVTLRLPGAPEPIVAEGEIVRRVRPSEGDRPGLGVRFVSLGDGATALGRFLGHSLANESDVPDVG